MGVAHGGQVVCSRRPRTWSATQLPTASSLLDLGEHRLRDLSRPERVFQVVRAGLRVGVPAVAVARRVAGEPAVQMTTSSAARRRSRDSCGPLARDRLVTLTGVGGRRQDPPRAAGRGRGACAEFPDGAWLCELAPVARPDAVWETLAATLRVQPPPGQPARGVGRSSTSRPKRLLLVLDNCEHLLDAVARRGRRRSVRVCPAWRCSATSREGSASAGEQIVAVPSLGVPADVTRA